MKTSAFVLFCLLLWAPRGISATTGLAEANNQFALDLYAELAETPGNLFFSPYSISTAMALVHNGAHGETERQIGRVMHFTANQGGSTQFQRQLAAASSGGIELNMANGLWAQRGHPFSSGFLNVAKTEFQAQLRQVDFLTEAPQVTTEINRWVEQSTKGKIKDLLPPGSLDDRTRLVLANAIYFKGAWAKPFEKARTDPQPFHLTTGRQATVPLMHHSIEVNYHESPDFQAIELPYGSGALSMLVLLPRETDGYVSLERRLKSAVAEALAGGKRQKVDIFLPRFKLESEFELRRALAQLGIKDAFSSKADFSGIDGSQNLYLSGVFHKAWAEINESGTEAAAATAPVFSAKSAMIGPQPVFRADHPFVFLIRETASGSFFFVGRLADPH